jgi:hypothetical protein
MKYKDAIVSNRQRWSQVEIKEIAEQQLRLYAKDYYIVVPTSRTYHQRTQAVHHACKIYSYLWVLVKQEN